MRRTQSIAWVAGALCLRASSGMLAKAAAAGGAAARRETVSYSDVHLHFCPPAGDARMPATASASCDVSAQPDAASALRDRVLAGLSADAIAALLCDDAAELPAPPARGDVDGCACEGGDFEGV